jgi:hypothetical protein
LNELVSHKEELTEEWQAVCWGSDVEGTVGGVADMAMVTVVHTHVEDGPCEHFDYF